MKKKIFILCVSFLMTGFVSFSQDSVRTKNDKPGTPASLRTPDASPQNTDPLINQQRPKVGTINHGATENTKVVNTVPQTNGTGTVIIPRAIKNGDNNIHKSTPSDSVIINGAYYKKPSNVTNPIRHQ